MFGNYNTTSDNPLLAMTDMMSAFDGRPIHRFTGNIIDNPRWRLYTAIYGSLVATMLIMTVLRSYFFTKVS